MHSVGKNDDTCAYDDDGNDNDDGKTDGIALVDDDADAGDRLIEGIADGATTNGIVKKVISSKFVNILPSAIKTPRDVVTL